jgi:ATP-binding cassette subfamily B protein
LLVLDNVLSAVDNDTERFLLNELFNGLGRSSALIVSHRASVLERVDHVLVLEEGRIVARGHHDELMKSSPIYQEIWRLQQEEAAELEVEA